MNGVVRVIIDALRRSHEATTVRLIFDRYLSVGSMLVLMRELNEQKFVTRKRRLSSGKRL
jgi:hypothetical protein